MTRSSNPEGRRIQTARHGDGATVEAGLRADIGALNARLASQPGGIGPVGAGIGPIHAEADLDLPRAQGLFLAPGIGAQGATMADVARCFAACPERVLPSASRSVPALGPEVARLGDGAARLADEAARALGGS